MFDKKKTMYYHHDQTGNQASKVYHWEAMALLDSVM